MALNWENANRRDSVRVSEPLKGRAQVTRYWWIKAKYRGRCSLCSERVGQGEEAAYDSLERNVICEICADSSGITAEMEPSRSYQRKRAK